MTNSPEPIGDAFQRAVEHWRRRQGEVGAPAEGLKRAPPLTVAISREAGCGGQAITDELAARLHWPVYDKALVEHIAKDSGLQSEVVQNVDEHRSNFIVETLEAFVGASTMGGAGYAHRLRKTLAALAAHGECVIVGRGGSAILPPESTVSVRIVASLSDRVTRYGKRHQVGPTVAKAEVKRIDRERQEFVQQYFHKDVNDPHLYDLVINTSRLPIEICVELCEHALREKEERLRRLE